MKKSRIGILNDLFDGPGWTVVDTGLAEHTDDEVVSGAWNLFTVLCEPAVQYRGGELVHPVEVVDRGAPGASHYSQSNKSGAYHTDGTLLDVTPEIIMLAGISTADEGGETVIVDGLAALADLSKKSTQDLGILEEFHPFHSGDNDDTEVAHQVIDNSARPSTIRYMRRYLELGYARAGQRLPNSMESVFEEFDTIVANSRYQSAVMVERGHALLWNNSRFLHGRRPFTEFQRRRQLVRTYGMRSVVQH